MSTLPLFPGLQAGGAAGKVDVVGDAEAIAPDQRGALPQEQAHATRRAGLLQELARAGALRTLDHALAQSLRRLDPDTPDTVLAAAALASLAVASGHAGFDPAAPQRLVDLPINWP